MNIDLCTCVANECHTQTDKMSIRPALLKDCTLRIADKGITKTIDRVFCFITYAPKFIHIKGHGKRE